MHRGEGLFRTCLLNAQSFGDAVENDKDIHCARHKDLCTPVQNTLCFFLFDLGLADCQCRARSAAKDLQAKDPMPSSPNYSPTYAVLTLQPRLFVR